MRRGLLVLLVVGVLIFVWAKPVLFQEGSPELVIKGIVTLHLTDRNIVQFDEEPRKYISQDADGNEPLIELLSMDGWVFVEQMGSGYFFENNEEKLFATGVMYTRWYRVWTIN